MMKHYKSQNGFTLVEMALVLIIVSLIIAGILKGQELIKNSQVTSTIQELEGYVGAVNTFTDSMFGVLPGDMTNAQFRLEDCNADPCNNGNGNDQIDVALGAQNAIDDESAYFFNQLRSVGLIANFSGQAVAEFGGAFPSAPTGGGYMVGDTRAGNVEFDTSTMREGIYLLVVARIEDVDVDTGILTPTEAARIDRVLDNGIPNSGRVQSQRTDGACVNTFGDDEYDEIDSNSQTCVIAYRIR